MKSIGTTVVLGFLVLTLSLGCKRLPSVVLRAESHLVSGNATSPLGSALAPALARFEGQTGFVAIPRARDAFAVRALLAQAAQQSLDLQYYIWHNDISGSLLFAATYDAAERGVRVRLLIDDNNSTPALDAILAALDAHQNIEVRLFNPFLHRRAHLLGFLTDFSRLNRRMHNKSFTVDRAVTVAGGRNMGDEYFGADDNFGFADLDALAVGSAVTEVARDFEAYWASQSVYPLASIIKPLDSQTAARAITALRAVGDLPEAKTYIESISRLPLVRNALAGQLDLEWTTVRLISDDPLKGLGQATKGTRAVEQLSAVLGQPASELQLVSPYFVPTASGTKQLVDLAQRGIKVSLLTNSLEATDVNAVHGGYAKWRKTLLRGGVSLFEVKRSLTTERKDKALFSLSASSLHAKVVALDRARVFIGSLNLDPRSAYHNTELGFIIDSKATAAAISDLFAKKIQQNAYEVRLGSDGNLVWLERRGDELITHHQEPGVGLLRRITVKVLTWLPIDSLL